MKLERLSVESARSLVQELRSMADLPAGANAAALRRAKEIRFLLRAKSPLESFRKEIKSSCARLQAHLVL